MGADYFFGDPIQKHTDEEGFDRQAWFQKSRKQAEEAVPKWIEGVRQRYGN